MTDVTRTFLQSGMPYSRAVTCASNRHVVRRSDVEQHIKPCAARHVRKLVFLEDYLVRACMNRAIPASRHNTHWLWTSMVINQNPLDFKRSAYRTRKQNNSKPARISVQNRDQPKTRHITPGYMLEYTEGG
jgi:hypothetical protein